MSFKQGYVLVGVVGCTYTKSRVNPWVVRDGRLWKEWGESEV